MQTQIPRSRQRTNIEQAEIRPASFYKQGELDNTEQGALRFFGTNNKSGKEICSLKLFLVTGCCKTFHHVFLFQSFMFEGRLHSGKMIMPSQDSYN